MEGNHVTKRQLEAAVKTLEEISQNKGATNKDRMIAVSGIFHANEHYVMTQLNTELVGEIKTATAKGLAGPDALKEVKKMLKDRDRKAWEPAEDDEDED